MDHLKEHARTLHRRIEVVELAALFAVVENPELAHGVDETGVEREASVKVLVVVVRHREQRCATVLQGARGGRMSAVAKATCWGSGTVGADSPRRSSVRCSAIRTHRTGR